jgi:integrase
MISKAKAARLGEGGDRFVWDTKLTGFGYRVRNNHKTYVVQYRVKDTHLQRRLKIGDAAKLSEAQAREQARKILAAVQLGKDPAAERKQSREDARFTFKTVVADYLRAKRAAVRSSTYIGISRYLGVDPDADARKRKRDLSGYWSSLHSLPINRIDRRIIASELTKITSKHGAASASVARATLSAFFVWALGEGLAEHNPVVGTNRPNGSKPRERLLDGTIKDGDEQKLHRLPELRAVWRAAGDDDYGQIVRLLVLTACRREEIGGLRSSELDFENRMICLPGSRVKNGRAHDIPLSDLAWSLLPERRGESEFVFGRKGFAAWGRGKAALDERLGEKVAPWTLHDVRRTVATRMADLGVQPHVIEAVLNHQGGHKSGVAGIYNRSSYEKEVRAALMLWSDHVRATVEGKSRKIVPLRQAEKVS